MSFPNILDVVEQFNVLHSDVVALLGYEPSKQVEVMKKVQTFLGKMAHIAIVDMVCIHCQSELADMWYIDNLPIHRQETCEEVCAQFISMAMFC